MGLYEVYTYGNGGYIAALFNAIALMVGGDDYYGLIKLAGMIGLLYIILQGFLAQKVNPQYIIIYAVILMTLLSPRVNIGIVDRVQPANNVVIGNVPLGVGIFAHFTSTIGDGLTRLAESSFALPGDLKYQDGGLAGSVSLMYSSKKFIFPPSNTKTDLDEFIRNCTFYEIAAGQKNIQDLLRSQNILDYIATGSTRFTTVHPDSGTSTIVDTCVSAYGYISDKIAEEYPAYLDILERTLFDQITGALESKLVNVYDYLGNVSDTGYDIIIQNSMINMISESFETDAELSGINLSLGALSVSQAEQQQRVSWFTTGALAKRVLPMLRSILEGLLYGLFPFVFILFLLPNGFKYILAYLTNLFWIQSWGFFFVILNLGINIAAQRDISAITDGLGYGIAIIDHANLYQASADFINMSGAMAMAVPLISLGIITGSGYAVVNSIGSMTNAADRAAESAGGSVGMGNMSYGNMSANNKSYDNTNAHKENTVWDTQIGSNATFYDRTQAITGSSMDHYGFDGQPAMSIHTGNGPISLSTEAATRSAYNHSVGRIEQKIESDTQTMQKRLGGVISDMGSYAQSSQMGESRGVSENSGRQLQYGNIAQDVANTIRTKGMDEKVLKDRANQILGAATLGVMAPKIFGGSGVKGQRSWNFRGNELKAYNNALQAMESMGVSNVRQDMKTFSETNTAGTTNSDTHAHSQTGSAVLNEAQETIGNITESYSHLDNIQDQYNEIKENRFGVSTQLAGEFNSHLKEKYGDNWKSKYRESLTNDKVRDQEVYDFMVNKVFNGEEIFGGSPGTGIKEQAIDAGVGVNSELDGVQFEGSVNPVGVSEGSIRYDINEKQKNLKNAHSTGGQAFYINPDVHDPAIQQQRSRLKKGHENLNDGAELNIGINKGVIEAKGREVKNYKDNIGAEEIGNVTEKLKEAIGEPLGLNKMNEDANNLDNDPTWGKQCDTK